MKRRYEETNGRATRPFLKRIEENTKDCATRHLKPFRAGKIHRFQGTCFDNKGAPRP
jgi:hypothetical protein